nr:hypothetical protein [Tanacetum cinerariifolium]
MENSKRGSIPMQEKLKLSKSQGASTPAEMKRMQNVPYASAVGSIMYVVRCTRPDVAFVQNITSRFQQNPGDLKRELRVSCYTDAGYLTDADDLKPQTGYVFVLNGGAVDWKIAKQIIFATSSAEAEYIAAFDASKEAVWVRKFISRHFRAKVHYLREVIEFGDIKLEKVHTDDNLADPFTKALPFPKHSEHTKNIGMLPEGEDLNNCLQLRNDSVVYRGWKRTVSVWLICNTWMGFLCTPIQEEMMRRSVADLREMEYRSKQKDCYYDASLELQRQGFIAVPNFVLQPYISPIIKPIQSSNMILEQRQ